MIYQNKQYNMVIGKRSNPSSCKTVNLSNALQNSGTGSPFKKIVFHLVKNDIFISALNINNTADIQQKLYTIHTKNELLSWDEQKVMMTGGGKGRV